MKTLIAALVATTFSIGAFAQSPMKAASAPMAAPMAASAPMMKASGTMAKSKMKKMKKAASAPA